MIEPHITPIYDYAIHNTRTGERHYTTAPHRKAAIHAAPWPAWQCTAQAYGRRFDLEKSTHETQDHD